MSPEANNVILVLAGALISGLLYVNYKQSVHLRDMLPPSFVPLIPVLLNTITDLSSRTETTLDDEVVAKLKELLEEKPKTEVA